MERNICDWNPTDGMAFQGDVAIIRVAKSVTLRLVDEIAPINHRLILQEGEVSGHHHAIDLRQRPTMRPDSINRQVEHILFDAASGNISLPSARLYRDLAAVEQVRALGIITRVDLVIGLLIVEVGSMVLSHEEHDGVRIPPGAYLVGRQIESAGAEERVVRD